MLSPSTGALPLGDFGSFLASGLAGAHGLDPFDVLAQPCSRCYPRRSTDRVYAQWLGALSREGLNPQVANAAIAGALVRFGVSPASALATAALGLIAAAAWVWRQRPSAVTTSGIAIVVLLLRSPLARRTP